MGADGRAAGRHNPGATTAAAEGRAMTARVARPGSVLLINEPPLQVLPTLAGAVGLAEAIVLQQLHYWLQRTRHERDGRAWVRFTYEEWQAQLPWWSLRTLKTLLPDLEARGLIATANYNRHPTDRTKWYTIDYDHPALAGPAPGPTSPLLIAEPPLQALPTLARAIGLNEALVLQQVHYRLRHARHERDGRRWVYNTYEQWQEEFPWWSIRTLKRIFHSLEERGLLLTATYNRSPLDRTKWYAVRYEHPLLAGAPPSSSVVRPECNPGTIASCNPGTVGECEPDTMASCEADPLAVQDRHDRGATLAHSNQETPAKTSARSTTEIGEGEQQQGAPSVAADGDEAVVVAPLELLVGRGVTPVTAARLVAAVAARTIARQVAIYDWLRERAPDDDRLTPGRLRRMIEEDWAPPP
ncbi:MAG TPA: hypothetical protein VFW96_00295, partial [Thermomicrobiales bacterium]|nr:hypothetical protein [Thermomicrobiales bacterium]